MEDRASQSRISLGETSNPAIQENCHRTPFILSALYGSNQENNLFSGNRRGMRETVHPSRKPVSFVYGHSECRVLNQS